MTNPRDMNLVQILDLIRSTQPTVSKRGQFKPSSAPIDPEKERNLIALAEAPLKRILIHPPTCYLWCKLLFYSLEGMAKDEKPAWTTQGNVVYLNQMTSNPE